MFESIPYISRTCFFSAFQSIVWFFFLLGLGLFPGLAGGARQVLSPSRVVGLDLATANLLALDGLQASLCCLDAVELGVGEAARVTGVLVDCDAQVLDVLQDAGQLVDVSVRRVVRNVANEDGVGRLSDLGPGRPVRPVSLAAITGELARLARQTTAGRGLAQIAHDAAAVPEGAVHVRDGIFGGLCVLEEDEEEPAKSKTC